MNLCVNARDAMPQGGALAITTGNIKVDGDGLNKQPYIAAGEYVMLSVSDTGSGIAKDVQRRIFDPFFTTKEVGKGTGLGLSTVYGIVKQSGGYVWVDSEPGHGASFTIYLPRAQRTIVPDIAAKAEARPRGTGTILVTEDEDALREAVCDYLRGLGYTLLEARSGQEALSLTGKHEGHIDLLITDLVMPKMSGGELSQMLSGLRPDLKTIYMSGYADDARLRPGMAEANTFFLQKPFSLGALARKVRDTLERIETVQ
jgi:CheY-like chemotaxis protein